MYQAYFKDFFERFSYPEEACSALEGALGKITNNERVYQSFLELIQRYENDMKCDFRSIRARIKEVSAEAGVHEYVGNAVLVICLSKTLLQYYLAAGYDEEFWYTTMYDLKWKTAECKEIYDVWGVFAPEWYDRFFKLERFCFGKLQFELNSFGKVYEKDGIFLTPDSTVLNVHIPRTGGKLDRESMLSAYSQASEFFKDEFEANPIVFVCKSWLLYPRNKEVLSEKSNLYAFISDYDVIWQGEYEDYSQAWRLFSVQYDGNVDHLPQNTSLRRAYAEWIRNGEKMGWGYGVFIYKEEK